ncbi:tRNA (adenosine(37)-N6)-threonylcarbamoyltransferase complex transferase subunit TsaD [Lentibacillus halophilus]|uniref:tRNA N6-adenosine threonylcarbamoyltransferase n=1 Tax=Lentibacillus halophilus TaxID=295065 RepID=A0ABP3IXI7_9BACI
MNDKKDTYILGIETSCDETAAAIVKNGDEIVSNVVASQIDSHKRFGGVVPEIASRHHVEQMTIVLEEAFEQADMTWDDVDAVAVTEGPGLVGALLVGVNSAKALAFARQKPLIGVHHLAGHIYANRFQTEFEFPLLALIVSGGHTELIVMHAHGNYELIGETRDDAAGEAYDKIARVLELPYPGGPQIDKLAAEGEASMTFPRAWLESDSYDFSFSGLKSSVINTIHNATQRGESISKQSIAASFQSSVVDVLTTKTWKAAQSYQVRQVIVAGGVAANAGLRRALENQFQDSGIPLAIPPLELCTDNAAMIAAAGFVNNNQGKRSGWDLNANPSLPLK